MLSPVSNTFLEQYKKEILQIFLRNGVTLTGKISLWDDVALVISCYNKNTQQTMVSLVRHDSYYTIKQKNEGQKNGK